MRHSWIKVLIKKILLTTNFCMVVYVFVVVLGGVNTFYLYWHWLHNLDFSVRNECSLLQISDFNQFLPACISKNALRLSTCEVSACTKVNCCNVFACPSRMGEPVELHFSHLKFGNNPKQTIYRTNWDLQCLFALLSCRLALYVYEYLLHVGAQKSAQTFLSEVSGLAQSTFPSKQLLLCTQEKRILIQARFEARN